MGYFFLLHFYAVVSRPSFFPARLRSFIQFQCTPPFVVLLLLTRNWCLHLGHTLKPRVHPNTLLVTTFSFSPCHSILSAVKRRLGSSDVASIRLPPHPHPHPMILLSHPLLSPIATAGVVLTSITSNSSTQLDYRPTNPTALLAGICTPSPSWGASSSRPLPFCRPSIACHTAVPPLISETPPVPLTRTRACG